MKYIGIDYGTKNIGVAISDDGGRIAFPHSVVRAGPQALSAIDALIKESGVGQAVVGESRTLGGEANPLQEDIERFVKDLQGVSGVPVSLHNEFFTSALAARQFAPEEKSRKKNPHHEGLDASAAALILQSFLDTINR